MAAPGGFRPSHSTMRGFRILREIGRGGMGVVYEAEDEVLNRRVALKVLAAAAVHRRKQVERFEREAKAAARLHHTNIVPVFGVGYQDGQHYYVMQYIEGKGLDVVLGELRRSRAPASEAQQPAATVAVEEPALPWAAHRILAPDERTADAAEMARSLLTGRFAGTALPESEVPIDAANFEYPSSPPVAATGPTVELPFVEPGSSELSSRCDMNRPYFSSIARIGLQAAEALDYANRQGVLHRDVKPSNLLLDTQGNVWLADFGLAKTAETDDLTTTGEILGTIRYMAPERFRGECDARSDLYALGLTLYELLALRPAFPESDRLRLIEQIRWGESPRLHSLAPKVPRDLATIIDKSLAREPSRRYPGAAALADDLRRFLEGRPISARQASRVERLSRWLRRNPWVAAFLMALMLGLCGSAWQAIRATRAEQLARSAEAATRNERDLAEEEAAKTKKSESEARAVLDFFQNKLMAASRPAGQEGGLGKDVTLRAAIDAAERGIAQSFATQPAVEASIRDTLGESYYYQGQIALAIRQYERALDLRRQALGPDHAETIASMNNLALAYLETGRLAGALKLLEEALKRCKAKLAFDDPLAPVTMGNLAHAYADAGRFADAVTLDEEALERLRAKVGPDHMHTLIALNNLANAYRGAGRPAEALPRLEEALARLRKTVGPNHPTTMLAMSNLALAYTDAGRVADAIPLHEEALELSVAQLRAEHPDTLFAMNCLARACLDVKPAETESLSRRLMAIRDKTNPDDWSAFDVRSLLGASLLRQKKYAEAEPLLLEGYAGLEARATKIPIPSRKRVTEALDRIVELYDAWGKKGKALEWRKKQPSPGVASSLKK